MPRMDNAFCSYQKGISVISIKFFTNVKKKQSTCENHFLISLCIYLSVKLLHFRNNINLILIFHWNLKFYEEFFPFSYGQFHLFPKIPWIQNMKMDFIIISNLNVTHGYVWHITSEKATINSISRRNIGFMKAVRLNQYFKNTFCATFIVVAFLDFSTVSTGKYAEVLYGFYTGAEF